MCRPILVLATILALAALTAGCDRPSTEPAEHHDIKAFPAADGKLVRLEVSSLDPEIEVAAGDAIMVEVSLSARASSRAAASRWVERRKPQMDDSPAALEIRAVPRRGSFFVGSLRTKSHLRVVLPPTCRLEVATSSGDVQVAGNETVTTPVRITTVSGDVTVEGGVRSLEVRTVSGDIKLSSRNLDQLQLRSTSGDVEVRAPLRSVLMDTTSGDVRLEDLIGDFSVHTTSGDVRAEWANLPMGGSIRANTTSGDVRLRLPSFVGVAGELRSRTGAVRTTASGRWERKDRHFILIPTPQEAPTAEATVGRTTITVEVVSRSGGISLRSN